MFINWVDYHCRILLPIDKEEDLIRRIECAYRVCYNSEMSTNIDEALNFIMKYKAMGHLSPFEHISISAELTCDRGLSHEIVRHRLCSFNQSSTRYIKYKNQIDCILPNELRVSGNSLTKNIFVKSVQDACDSYNELINLGISPQIARGVLPNCLATKLIVTSNLRNWYHIFDERYYNKAAHPDLRILMDKVYREFNKFYPRLFNNIIDKI